MAAVLCKFLRTQDFPTWIKIAAHEAMATWRLTAWRKAISDITTFLRTDRIARDRLFRSVEHAVKRRSWLAAFDANARFESALNQHLLMEEEVLVRALEQYSGDARKPIAAMVLEHQRMRRAAAGATAAIRRCNARSFLVNAKALRLIMAEHCRKEEGMVLAMADHYLRPAARFLIDSMRAMEIPICSDYPHAVPARAA